MKASLIELTTSSPQDFENITKNTEDLTPTISQENYEETGEIKEEKKLKIDRVESELFEIPPDMQDRCIEHLRLNATAINLQNLNFVVKDLKTIINAAQVSVQPHFLELLATILCIEDKKNQSEEGVIKRTAITLMNKLKKQHCFDSIDFVNVLSDQLELTQKKRDSVFAAECLIFLKKVQVDAAKGLDVDANTAFFMSEPTIGYFLVKILNQYYKEKISSVDTEEILMQQGEEAAKKYIESIAGKVNVNFLEILPKILTRPFNREYQLLKKKRELDREQESNNSIVDKSFTIITKQGKSEEIYCEDVSKVLEYMIGILGRKSNNANLQHEKEVKDSDTGAQGQIDVFIEKVTKKPEIVLNNIYYNNTLKSSLEQLLHDEDFLQEFGLQRLHLDLSNKHRDKPLYVAYVNEVFDKFNENHPDLTSLISIQQHKILESKIQIIEKNIQIEILFIQKLQLKITEIEELEKAKKVYEINRPINSKNEYIVQIEDLLDFYKKDNRLKLEPKLIIKIKNLLNDPVINKENYSDILYIKIKNLLNDFDSDAKEKFELIKNIRELVNSSIFPNIKIYSQLSNLIQSEITKLGAKEIREQMLAPEMLKFIDTIPELFKISDNDFGKIITCLLRANFDTLDENSSKIMQVIQAAGSQLSKLQSLIVSSFWLKKITHFISLIPNRPLGWLTKKELQQLFDPKDVVKLLKGIPKLPDDLLMSNLMILKDPLPLTFQQIGPLSINTTPDLDETLSNLINHGSYDFGRQLVNLTLEPYILSSPLELLIKFLETEKSLTQDPCYQLMKKALNHSQENLNKFIKQIISLMESKNFKATFQTFFIDPNFKRKFKYIAEDEKIIKKSGELKILSFILCLLHPEALILKSKQEREDLYTHISMTLQAPAQISAEKISSKQINQKDEKKGLTESQKKYLGKMQELANYEIKNPHLRDYLEEYGCLKEVIKLNEDGSQIKKNVTYTDIEAAFVVGIVNPGAEYSLEEDAIVLKKHGKRDTKLYIKLREFLGADYTTDIRQKVRWQLALAIEYQQKSDITSILKGITHTTKMTVDILKLCDKHGKTLLNLAVTVKNYEAVGLLLPFYIDNNLTNFVSEVLTLLDYKDPNNFELMAIFLATELEKIKLFREKLFLAIALNDKEKVNLILRDKNFPGDIIDPPDKKISSTALLPLNYAVNLRRVRITKLIIVYCKDHRMPKPMRHLNINKVDDVFLKKIGPTLSEAMQTVGLMKVPRDFKETQGPKRLTVNTETSSDKQEHASPPSSDKFSIALNTLQNFTFSTDDAVKMLNRLVKNDGNAAADDALIKRIFETAKSRKKLVEHIESIFNYKQDVDKLIELLVIGMKNHVKIYKNKILPALIEVYNQYLFSNKKEPELAKKVYNLLIVDFIVAHVKELLEYNSSNFFNRSDSDKLVTILKIISKDSNTVDIYKKKILNLVIEAYNANTQVNITLKHTDLPREVYEHLIEPFVPTPQSNTTETFGI